MKKQYISPKAKVKIFSLDRTGLMVDETFPKGSGNGPGIESGDDIESKETRIHFDVWEDE